MDLKKITGELARINTIMSRWTGAQSISDVEREIVLDKLRGVYESVMFFERETDYTTESVKENITQITEQENIEYIFREPISEKFIPATEPDIAQQSIPEPIPLPISDEPEAEALGETLAVRSLFDMNEISTSERSALNRKVVLSLYGEPDKSIKSDKPISATTIQDGEAPTPDATAVQEPEDGMHVTDDKNEVLSERAVLDLVIEELQAPVFTSDSHRNESHSKSFQILGEVMNNGGERLGDALSKQAASRTSDVASRVASAQTSSLRKAIGINDKFLIIKEVFSGDAAQYESTIEELDHFDDLNEAMIYIHDNYAWNPNNEGVNALMDILTRKLS